MPFVAGPSGYEPILEVHLDTVSVTSSLNDIRLVTAESCRVSVSTGVHLVLFLKCLSLGTRTNANPVGLER